MKLKTGNASGEDEVCAEMLKSDDRETLRIVCQMLQKLWDMQQAPEDWNTRLIVKLPQKGDLGIYGNWRGITLLSFTSTVFGRIMLNRITVAVEENIHKEHAGFRKGRSCTEYIFLLRQILEQIAEWNSVHCIPFVDFEKAFDSLHRVTLWKIIRA